MYTLSIHNFIEINIGKPINFLGPTLEGIDLEDAEGTEEEFTGHWERTTLFNEIMTGSGIAERPQSVFTLSLFV